LDLHGFYGIYIYRTGWTLHTGFAFKQIPFWEQFEANQKIILHPTKSVEVLTVSIPGGGATSLRIS
jgi:hypothetical protein